jgi:hypothetical protein
LGKGDVTPARAQAYEPIASRFVLVIAPVCPLSDETPPPDALIVTPPVEADTEIPEPAVTEVTPVLVSVGVLPPVDEMPVPVPIEVTPEVV